MLTARDIFDSLTRMGKEGSLSTPLNPLVVSAQAFHETGGFKHMCGSTNTNLAGVKCSKAWLSKEIPWSTGKCRYLNTMERYKQKDGTFKYVQVKAGFRDYGMNYELCLKDISDIIARKPWFADAKSQADNCWGYLAGLIARWTPGPNVRLIEPGWATGHKYFESVSIAIFKHAPTLLGEDWYDRLKNAFILAVQRNTLTPEQKAFLSSKVM